MAYDQINGLVERGTHSNIYLTHASTLHGPQWLSSLSSTIGSCCVL